MAEKKKSPNKSTSSASKTKVTRITATDARATSPAKTKTTTKKKAASTPPVKKAASTKTAAAKAVKSTPAETSKKSGAKFNPIRSFITYVKGAWYELRQVRWPNRRTTWSLSLAVLLFTAFFVALIVLLDFGFQWVFEQVLLG